MMIRKDVKVKVKVRKVKDAGGDAMTQDTLHLLLPNLKYLTQILYQKLLHQWKNGNQTEKHKFYGVNEMNYFAGVLLRYGAHNSGVETATDGADYHILDMKMYRLYNNVDATYANSPTNGYVHQVLRPRRNHHGKIRIDKTSPAQQSN